MWQSQRRKRLPRYARNDGKDCRATLAMTKKGARNDGKDCRATLAMTKKGAQ